VFAVRFEGFAYTVNVVGVSAATVALMVDSESPLPVTVTDKSPAVSLVTVTVVDTVEPSRDALSEIGFGDTVMPVAVPPFTVRVTLM
jgi:hypothetical protein